MNRFSGLIFIQDREKTPDSYTDMNDCGDDFNILQAEGRNELALDFGEENYVTEGRTDSESEGLGRWSDEDDDMSFISQLSEGPAVISQELSTPVVVPANVLLITRS